MKILKFSKLRGLLISQIISIIGFIAVFIISLSIENLQFNPGSPLPISNSTLPILPIGRGLHGNWIFNLFLSLLLAMFPLGVVLLILSSEARRIFKKYLKALVIWFVFLLSIRLYFLLFNNKENAEIGNSNTTSLPAILDPPSLSGSETASTVDIYTPPSFPSWQGYLIGFLCAMFIGILVYFFWFKNRSKEDDLKSIVIKTLADIKQGGQWEDAIIQCYAQMNSTVSRRKQINRPSFLTPAEFAMELTTAGLPSEPVKNLTSLFERARYGERSTHKTDKDEAIVCLKLITQALEETE